jgi:hypothetical protein
MAQTMAQPSVNLHGAVAPASAASGRSLDPMGHDGRGPRLPGFKRLAICTGCLSEAVMLAYCPGSTTRASSDLAGCHKEGVVQEHFHRTCTTCGHVWYERMLSAVHEFA